MDDIDGHMLQCHEDSMTSQDEKRLPVTCRSICWYEMQGNEPHLHFVTSQELHSVLEQLKTTMQYAQEELEEAHLHDGS